MKFDRIEHYDQFDTVTVFWADISCLPEEIQREARKIDGEEYNPDYFGVCVHYDWTEKEFCMVTDTDLSTGESHNVYYIDTSGDKHWFKTELSPEFTETVFAACNEELNSIQKKETKTRVNAMTDAAFCACHGLPIPESIQKYPLCPASPEEAGLFYAQTPEKDRELGAIGHVRIDFGRGGKSFYHTWRPRGPEELNTQDFKAELDEVVNELRKTVLKSLGSMRRYCWGHGGEIEGGSCCQNYGFTLETKRYLYRLRCNPTPGDYQAYLSCFDKQAQQMGLTERQVIDRVTFASGEHEEFTDPEKYLQTVREELPYQAT